MNPISTQELYFSHVKFDLPLKWYYNGRSSSLQFIYYYITRVGSLKWSLHIFAFIFCFYHFLLYNNIIWPPIIKFTGKLSISSIKRTSIKTHLSRDTHVMIVTSPNFRTLKTHLLTDRLPHSRLSRSQVSNFVPRPLNIMPRSGEAGKATDKRAALLAGEYERKLRK